MADITRQYSREEQFARLDAWQPDTETLTECAAEFEAQARIEALLAAADGPFDRAASKPSRFKVISAAEFVGEKTLFERFHIYAPGEVADLPRPKWLVRNLLPESGIAQIFGDSGSGKSFLAYDLGAAIANGDAWNGARTRKGRVLYVAAEAGTGMRQREKAYRQTYPGKASPHLMTDTPNLIDPESAPEFIMKVRAAGPWAWIVLDTQQAITSGADENSSQDMGKMLDYCRILARESGALVTLIHHSPLADKDRGRGWGGVKGALDAQIYVGRVGNTNVRNWSISKNKDAADGADGMKGHFQLKVVMIGKQDGEPDTSCVVEHTQAPKPQAPKRKEPATENQIAALAAIRKHSPNGEKIPFDSVDLMDNAIIKEAIAARSLPYTSQKRRDMLKAINRLAVDGHIWKDSTHCGLGDIRKGTEEDWLHE